jgi:hypothetical protein
MSEDVRAMRHALALLVLPVALVGCGGNEFVAASSGDSAADAGRLTDDQACGDNAHAHCLKIETCSPTLMATTYGAQGTCETRLKLVCLNSLEAPASGGSAQKTEACAQAYASWTCDDYLDDKPPPACAQALGALAAGKPCGAPGQCASGFCAIAPGSACGVCAPAPQVGTSCAALTTCGPLLVCNATTQQCGGFAASGGACGKAQPCGAGLFCVGGTGATNGTCAPAVEQMGAACDPLGKTGPGCDRLAGLTCNGTTKQCAAIQFDGTGQACGVVGGQAALCANAGTCVANTAPDAGVANVCLASAGDEAPCDLMKGPFCLDPARCVTGGDGGTQGTCQFPNPATCQ